MQLKMTFLLTCLFSANMLQADFDSLVYDRFSENVLNSFGVSGTFLAQLRAKNSLKSNTAEARWDYFLEKFDSSYEFIPILKSMIAKAGIPQEFLFLAMAESEFSTRAYSPKKAAGIWQLMPNTAKQLGLKINDYIDERRDPIKSTQAAIKYLQFLYKITGKWYLAAMAYNCGVGRLQKAIKEAKSTDIDVLLDEHKKYLPKETRSYIQMILSMSLAFNNIEKLKSEDREYLLNRGAMSTLASLNIKAGTMLSAIAEGAGMSLEDLKKYNRQFRYNFLPPGYNEYAVYIPYEKLAYFKQNFTQEKNPNEMFVLHKVKHGETLTSISKKYKVSIQEIKITNNLKNSFLSINQKLIVPVIKKNYQKIAQNEANH
ncbi:lytic transglycosylase domain-containing protein [Helicobacter sp. 11S03491-1]|uniref:lytic transglycosylase domain-containing protein n=1 Tax=Helicobacter sp. 11S03491-1 TaxID=1476196 RepID=UPI000BA6DC81|nr:lytic transglycosylase domain-containing protein [Helicobacter sp. 11S03491-1]PAF41985.1 lytic transglycosylase [Helicobacter sp. 11S03491-1]